MPNNFKLASEEEKIDASSFLRGRQTELVNIIEALNNVIPYWKTVNELIFKGLLDRLEKQLVQEASKREIDNPEVYRIQGQILWAKKYSDLYKLVETYKSELGSITNKLNENA